MLATTDLGVVGALRLNARARDADEMGSRRLG